MKSNIEDLINAISSYELTWALISQFELIAPALYQEMDTLRDKKGRPTDIYIRVVTREKARVPLRAASFFNSLASDEDACHSKYGENSVSIDILLDDNALFLLGHELGHVRYIIPNVADYKKFYGRQYAQRKVDLSNIGHSRDDASGKYANDFEKKFLMEKQTYFRRGGKKPESMFTLFNQFKREYRNFESGNPRSVIASNAAF